MNKGAMNERAESHEREGGIDDEREAVLHE